VLLFCLFLEIKCEKNVAIADDDFNISISIVSICGDERRNIRNQIIHKVITLYVSLNHEPVQERWWM
jgi:hypothetical protein